LWRGYFDDGEERVPIDVQFEFERHLVRGTSEDASGERCKIEGIRLPASGDVCWIAESLHDGRRWHWVGKSVADGLEGDSWAAATNRDEESAPRRRFRIALVRR
jgi:hypothetical protein